MSVSGIFVVIKSAFAAGYTVVSFVASGLIFMVSVFTGLCYLISLLRS